MRGASRSLPESRLRLREYRALLVLAENEGVTEQRLSEPTAIAPPWLDRTLQRRRRDFVTAVLACWVQILIPTCNRRYRRDE